MLTIPRRWSRVVAYALFAVSGIAALAWPAQSVRSSVATALVYVWAVFWVLGGGLSALGAATDRWLGELAGLPLLAAVFAVFGVSALSSGRLTSIAGGAGLIAIAAVLFARWRDVDLIRREAARHATEHEQR